MNVIEKVFGTHSERELKRILPIVDKIESLRDDMMALTDEQLKEAGVPAELIRISLGLEDKEDLIADISNALDAIRD